MPRLPAAPLFLVLTIICAVAPAAAQTSDELFDGTTLQELRITMSSRDLQTLRAEFAANTYYPADLQWRGVKLRNVGVRSRGSGSRSATKMGIQLDFNRYSSSQQFLGMTSLVLDNLVQDPAMIRERVSMAFYERMGLPAPRESFCRLYINDVYQGLYGVVEAITSGLLARATGDPTAYLYEFHHVPAFVGEYLGDELGPYKSMFEPRSHQKEADSVLYGPIRDLFREVNEPDDSVWRERVEALLDLEQFVKYVAVETYLSEIDGILSASGMSNFYLYRATGSTQHRLLPWDKDRTFSEYDSSVVAGADANVIFRRALAYADLKALYLDSLTACARSAATQFWLEREIVRNAQLIAAASVEDTSKPYSDADVTSAVSYLRTFARRRSGLVFQEVARLRSGS
jgi:spore coat protein H